MTQTQQWNSEEQLGVYYVTMEQYLLVYEHQIGSGQWRQAGVVKNLKNTGILICQNDHKAFSSHTNMNHNFYIPTRNA